MNVQSHMLFFTCHFPLKKQFKYLSLVKHFDAGYWIFSDIISILERGNQRIVKYFMDKSGVRFLVSRTPLTFMGFFLSGKRLIIRLLLSHSLVTKLCSMCV